jgi:nucleoside-diphosphate-sugar epimerase
MRALITGGAGFIGSNIARALSERRDEVIVLDNLLSGWTANIADLPRVDFIEGDIRDSSVLTRAMTNVEVVFHLAASVGNKRAIDDPVLDSDINVIGTLQVLEAMRREGVRRIVMSSSAGTYGELRTIPITEDHPMEPDTPYGASKLCAEKHCLAYAGLYDIDAVCLRYFNVYGPNQRFDAYGNVIPIFVFKLLAGTQLTVYGDGEQSRDFVNVHDVVQANIKAAGCRGITGAYNIGSGTQLTINRLVELLGELSGMEPNVVYGDVRPGDVRDSLASIDAAQRAFGYRPEVDFVAGLSEYVEWARREAVR